MRRERLTLSAAYLALHTAVCERLRDISDAALIPDDHRVAELARGILPAYVDMWVSMLVRHEADQRGCCPTCSRRWRRVTAPCASWEWAQRQLGPVQPYLVRVPLTPAVRSDRARRSA